MSAQKRTVSGALGGFLGFVGMSAVAGILVTAAVTPALALTGITASSTINMFENLPSYLEIDALAEKSNIYAVASDGSPVKLASFYDQNRERVGWDEVSQNLKDAAVAGEDPRFYEHGGIDLQGTVRAVAVTASGGNVQGGSSITQQYVKNVLVQNAVSNAKTEEEREAAIDEAIKQKPDRKLKEMRLAIGLEKQYSKDEILLGYLNIASFGGRVYGVQAAANYYFGVSAADVTIEQAASLIAMVNNPNELRIDQPDNEVNGAADGYFENLERRNYIIKKMFDEKKITQEQFDVAFATEIVPVITEPSTGCQTAAGSAYFCDYVTWIIKNNETFGATTEDRLALLQRGGLDIYTTIDLDLQWASEQAIIDNVPNYADGVDIGSTAVSVQPFTGRVLAMAQNRVYSADPEVLASSPAYSAVNLNTDYEYGGSSGFQPGSTYKVFTLGEWLKEGHSLNESIDGRRRANWGTFKDSCNGGTVTSGDWNPKNDEGGNGGSTTALQSTINSINTGFVGMAKQLDLCGIRQTAEAFGVHRADETPLLWSPATVLGTNEIAPLSMAVAFAGVAANGMVCDPIAIDRIVNSAGEDIPVPGANCSQRVDGAVAAGMAYAMQRVVSGGTASSSGARTEPWAPMIGKTGTTDNNEATWMSGATTKVATVVGVFNASGHVNLRNTYFDNGQAAQLRHQIWPRIMSVANAKYGGDGFPDVDSSALRVVQSDIPDVRGKTFAEAVDILEAAGFGSEDGGPQDSELPAGVVSSTNPTGSAGKGTIVAIYTSNGSMVLMPGGIVGSDEATAMAALAGFDVKVKKQAVTDPSLDGKVLATDPAEGTSIKAGSKVTITVGKS